MENIEIKNCDFPFNYYGKSRSECILDKRTGKKWCATKKDTNNKVIKKGWCIPNKKSRKKRVVKPSKNSTNPPIKKSVKSVKKSVKNNSNKQYNILVKNEKSPKFLKTYWDSTLYNNLFAIVYLYKKHKQIMCKPIGDIFNPKQTIEYLYPIDFQVTFTSTFEKFDNFKFMFNKKYQKLVLSKYELNFPKSEKRFFVDLYKCKKQGKRFYISEIYIEWGGGAHANILIFDLKNNICERFEPYGLQFSRTSNKHKFSNVFSSLVSQLLDKKMNVVLKRNKIKYIPPSKYCPDKSFQVYNNLYNTNNINNKDPDGYCGAWSIWWADLRLSNPDIPYNKLYDLALNKIKTSNLGFKKFIRNYSIFLTNNRIRLFNELKVKTKDKKEMLNLKIESIDRYKQDAYFARFLSKYLSKLF